MKPVNLNRLFVELMPSYGHVLNSLNENQQITKTEFLELFAKTFNVMEPRTNLLYYAIKQSEFETIKRSNGCAVFNE